MKALLSAVMVCAALLALDAAAAIEELGFASEADRARYEQLVAELRCPKCLNSNLAGSDAPIAADLRAEIYQQIEDGSSDDQIIEFMTARYGDFILYRPPLNAGTVLLWFGPLALLLGGFFVLRRMLAASAANTSDAGLSADEQRRLAAVLGSDKDQA
ncbi:MAG: cytochrome c-type biogenesis protein [Pseudohongiellaceae bacterium]|jgi:cytochrome c-type biogenesis protein CcmH